jgi:tetratricopeptide (TPR) repeat protein
VGQAAVVENWARSGRFVALWAAVVSAACWTVLAPPGPYLRDGGELSTAAFSLGVAHPTGFPLFCLLGKLATFLPVGEVQFRLHLLSALFGAIALYQLVRWSWPWLRGGGVATATAAVTAASAVWCVGETTLGFCAAVEVYAPLLALVATTLRLLAPHDRQALGTRDWLVASLLTGLSLGGHAWFRLSAAPLMAVSWAVALKRRQPWARYAPPLVILGALVVLYLPVASSRHPYVDWGEPRTLGALWEHLTAARIRAAFGDKMFSLEPLDVRVYAQGLGSLLEQQVGLVGLFVAAAGLAALGWARQWRWVGALVAILVLDCAYAIWVNPMGLDDRQVGGPATLALVAALLCGLGALGRLGPRLAVPLSWTVGALVAANVVAQGGLAAAWRSAPVAEPLAQGALAQAEVGAVLLTQSDDLTGAVMYEQIVAGARPDVVALPRQHLWLRSEVGRRLARAQRTLEPEPATLLSSATLWEPGDDGAPAGRALSPATPAWRVEAGAVRSQSTDRVRLMEVAAAAHRLFGPGLADRNVRVMLASALNALAHHAVAGRELRAASALYRAALQANSASVAATLGLGAVAAAAGRWEAAIRLAQRAVQLRPNHAGAWLHLGRYRMAAGQDGPALEDVGIGLRLAPRRADGHALRGTLLARRGEFMAAAEELREALRLDPRDEDARVNLRLVTQRLRGGP